jgi:tetratricopeptide (TPR) repeat protein
MQHPELLDDRSMEKLHQLLEEYPYFQTARLLKIKNLHNQGSLQYERMLKETALWITDRSKLFYLLDERVVVKDEDAGIKEDFTAEAIDFDQLLKATGTDIKEDKAALDDKKEKDELDVLIQSSASGFGNFFNVNDKVDLGDFKNTFKKKKEENSDSPTPEKTGNRKNQLIDKFIKDEPKLSKPVFKEEPAQDISESSVKESNELITDTLAKIYVKQEKYEKAIEAYEKLILKYP